MSRWQDGVPVTGVTEKRDNISTATSGAFTVVEPSFDENVLRALCELDVSLKLSRVLRTEMRMLDSVEFPYCSIESSRVWSHVESVFI